MMINMKSSYFDWSVIIYSSVDCSYGISVGYPEIFFVENIICQTLVCHNLGDIIVCGCRQVGCTVWIIYSQYSFDWFESQIDSNNIYYLLFQNWDMDLQHAYNRCKLTIQILLCSNSIPYKTFVFISYTLNYIQYTNYTLSTHSTSSSNRLWTFHTSVQNIFFLYNYS